MNAFTTLEQSKWLDEKIREVTIEVPNLGHVAYTGMADYLERNCGGAWPGLAWIYSKTNHPLVGPHLCFLEYPIEWEEEVVADYGSAVAPALPYTSGDGKSGALEILEREFGILWSKDSDPELSLISYTALINQEYPESSIAWIDAPTPSELLGLIMSKDQV